MDGPSDGGDDRVSIELPMAAPPPPPGLVSAQASSAVSSVSSLGDPPTQQQHLSKPGGATSGLVLPVHGDELDADEEGVYRWPELICVYVAIIADAIVANTISPYAVAWVRDSFNVDRNVGLYSGLLVGSFSFATALTSPLFGWLSDLIGRRLLMAGGLLSAGVLTLIGGMSGNYWVVFSMRFLAGLADASQTVSFAAIGDVTTGKARFVAFGYSKAASQIAKILTSLIGGMTYNMRPHPIFRDIPGYNNVLLSHLIAFGSCLAGVILIVVLYREGPEFTHVTARIRRVKTAVRLQQREDSILSLVSAQSMVQLFEGDKDDDDDAVVVVQGGHDGTGAHGGGPLPAVSPVRRQPPQQEPPPLSSAAHHFSFVSPPRRPALASPTRSTWRRPLSHHGLALADALTFNDEPTLLNLMATRTSSVAVARRSRRPIQQQQQQQQQEAPREQEGEPVPFSPPLLPRGGFFTSFVGRPSFWAGLRYVLTNPLLLRLILVYSLTSFLNGGLFLSITLLAQAKGGYDMTPKDASIIMLLFGSWAIVFNALFFKPVVSRLGQKRANGLGLLLTGFGVLGLPIGDYFIRSHTVKLWACIAMTVLVFGAGYMLVNSILASFISLHASREMQGIAQGVASFSSQALSGLGPMAFGALNNAIHAPIPVFLCLTTGYSLAFLALAFVPRRVLERTKSVGDDD